MEVLPLQDSEFEKFRVLLYDLSGISLSDAKKALVSGRLLKRLRHYNFQSYGQYYKLIHDGNEAEKQIMINLLSTNETRFFREDDHFTFLQEHIRNNYSSESNFRAWSAACSSGEEVYTISFILAKMFKNSKWEVYGSDINEDVVNHAKKGVYPIERAEGIPAEFLKNYCLRGVRSQSGKFMIKNELKNNIHFYKLNLLNFNPEIGRFDVIFLRNVMIYFNSETRKRVVENMLKSLNDNGLLFVGHAESLIGISDKIKAVKPTIYYKKQE